MKTFPVIQRRASFSLTFPKFDQVLIQANHLHMLVFIVSVYFSGMLNVFDSHTYLLHTGRILIFKYDGLTKIVFNRSYWQ